MAKFSSQQEANRARLRAMMASETERQLQREKLAMMANSRLRPRKEQEGHAETPLFQTTLEQFI